MTAEKLLTGSDIFKNIMLLTNEGFCERNTALGDLAMAITSSYCHGFIPYAIRHENLTYTMQDIKNHFAIQSLNLSDFVEKVILYHTREKVCFDDIISSEKVCVAMQKEYDRLLALEKDLYIGDVYDYLVEDGTDPEELDDPDVLNIKLHEFIYEEPEGWRDRDSCFTKLYRTSFFK